MQEEREHRRPGERMLAIRVLAMPADTNPNGDVFGGWLMSQADVAGGIVAYEMAHGRVATVAVNSFRFLRPVLVGDLVSCYAEVQRIGSTSIAVDVEVFVERGRNPEQVIRVAEGTVTYVAIDETGSPRSVPRRHAEP